MKKKILTYAASTAILSSLVLAGSAFAVDNVGVQVNSQDIREAASCDKAGDFTFKFDSGTDVAGGDQITMDLDYVSSTVNAALCRDIDIVFAPAVNADINVVAADLVTSDGWDHLDTPVEGGGITSAVTQVEDSSGIADPNIAVDGGVIFLVTGTAGTQRVTMDVISADADDDGDVVTISNFGVGADPLDSLTIKILDQRINLSAPPSSNDYGLDSAWIDNTLVPDGIYETAATLADNTMCIDISDWNVGTVDVHIKSALTKYSFDSPDPEVAHVVPAADYAKYTCSKSVNCGDIVLGTAGIQGAGASCGLINNENPTVAGTAYCATGNQHLNNQLYIQKTSGFFDVSSYQVQMKLLVNGTQSSTQGAYFTSAPMNIAPLASTASINCSSPVIPVGAAPVATYTNSAGASVTPDAPGAPDCTVGGQAVNLITAANTLGVVAGTHRVLYFGIPEINYTLSQIQAGDVISVDVTLMVAPCGELITVNLCLGTFVDACTIVSAGNTIVFPYFTAANAGSDSYWDGIAVSNMSTSAGTITFTMVEQDGDISTATVAIGANSMIIDSLANMLSSFALTTTVEGTVGNSPAYITAKGDVVVIDGFAMMGDNATGQSMGYLPRQ
ncbi:MAG: hypothetical protein KKB30_06470 [Proteobacteria bacterium]|nr:hypothetical protein [Pseudomonadota bacterium]MBU1715164.1 hypothetical protein [Pseudomonadota bacterium]